MLFIASLLVQSMCPALPSDYEVERLLKEDRLVCLYNKWWYIDENKKVWTFFLEEDVD